MKKAPAETAVMVTTAHKGVLFGYATDTTGDRIILRNARVCISWSSDLRGFGGLATSGPNKNCRVGPAVPSMDLRGITSVSEVTPEAIKAWESQPWA